MAETLTASDLAARLRDVPIADVPAVRLLLELQTAAERGDVDSITGRQQEMEAAISLLNRQIEQAKGVVEQCCQLQPVPSRRVPAGI